MQWWNDVVAWFNSAQGTRVITLAIIPFVAIVVAGVVAALIGRSSSKRLLARQDREIKAAAIMALIGAGRRAAIWSSLGSDEKQHVDALISESDLRMRLLPVSGAIAAADWATHELGAMKKNSSNFSFQAEQTFFDYRDRLLDWQLKPAKAKKLFAFDLVQWQYENSNTSPSSLVLQQQEYAAENSTAQPTVYSTPAAAPVSPPPATTPLVTTPPPAAAHAPVFATAPVETIDEASLRAKSPVAEPIIIDGPTDPSDTSDPTDTAVIPEPASETTAVASDPVVASADEIVYENTDTSELSAAPSSSSPSSSSPSSSSPSSSSPSSSSTDSLAATDAKADAEAQDETDSPFAPPVNAGAVRARTAPDQSLENS